MASSSGPAGPLNLSDELLAQLGTAIPGVDGSAVPPQLRKAIDYALQELVKAAKPATRRSPAEPADPIAFVVDKLRAFAQAERNRISDDELALIKKRRGRGGRGRRGARRRSVVCSAGAAPPEDGWTPTVVPKPDDVRAALRDKVSKSILLHGANDHTIDTVVNCMFKRVYEPGATIIQEGDPGDNLYLCTEGWTEVVKLLPWKADGDEREGGKDDGELKDDGPPKMVNTKVARLEAGATFGELALMYNAPRSATVLAGDDGATCWAIDRLTFRHSVRTSIQSRRKAYVDALKAVPILEPLSEYEHTRLADCVDEEKFEPDQVILEEGAQGDFFYIVLEGEVKVTKEGIDAEVCERLKKGAYFGEVALLMDIPRTATVTAVQLTRTARIDRDVFKRILGPLGDILHRNMSLYNKYEEQ